MATVKLIYAARAVSTALTLMAISPGAAFALWQYDAGRWSDIAEPFHVPGRHAPESAKGVHTESSTLPLVIGEDVPASVCELVGGMYTKERVLRHAGQPAADLLDQAVPVSAGMGYDLGPRLRFQGVGIFDTSENYASLGPAFRLNLHEGLEITTGMQLPVTERMEGSLPDLYYAEFTLVF